MKKTLIAAALAVVAVPALAQTIMKPGLWELRTTKQVMDGQDMLAQMAGVQAEMQKMMANMSAAQKKQMEAMMGKQAGTAGNVHRICISPEMAARDRPMTPDDRCEPARISRSGNKLSFEFNCTTDGRTMVGKGESILGGDTVNSRMDMVMTDARGKHTMQTESQMKYLGADCQGIKPADQIARELQQARQVPARGK